MICADCAAAWLDPAHPIYTGGCDGCSDRMLLHARGLWRERMIAWRDERHRFDEQTSAESRALHQGEIDSMSDDATPTSFDALAHERNLSPKQRDVLRRFFIEALRRSRGIRARSFQSLADEHNMSPERVQLAREFDAAGARIGARQSAAVQRSYNRVLDRDTASGEFL